MESCILPILQPHLELAPHQHGFRKQHSTVTALNNICADISTGFNQKKPPLRTLLVAIDLTKAFDTVCHIQLLTRLNQSSLPGSIVRWLAAYLHGRKVTTLFKNHLSKARTVHFGVPQGSVISPLLFNYYLADAPLPPSGTKLMSSN